MTMTVIQPTRPPPAQFHQVGRSVDCTWRKILTFDAAESRATSSPPTDRSAISMVEAGEELVQRADERLARLNRLMGKFLFPWWLLYHVNHNCTDGNNSEDATDILERNRGLIARYQFARNQYVINNNDILKIQHMLQMFRQIDDPLTVLELTMKKKVR